MTIFSSEWGIYGLFGIWSTNNESTGGPAPGTTKVRGADGVYYLVIRARRRSNHYQL